MGITHHQCGPADLRLVETDLPEIGPGGVLERVHRATVSRQASPILRRAAYLAALKGDPWRLQM